MATVVERVDTLEEVVKNFVRDVGIEFNKVYNTQLRTEIELQALKEDTQAFKDEMRALRDEMGLYREDTQAFKDEMRAFRDEARAENREMNRRWGELANRLGTLVEDLMAPSLPRIVKEVLGIEVDDLFVRYRRRRNGQTYEYDAIARAGDLAVLNYTKATLSSRDVDRFVEDIERFREIFPEHADRPIIGVLAALSVESSVLAYAEKTGLLVLGVGDQVMEVKNRPGFVPRRWWEGRGSGIG
jgi:hypothetical protein